MQILRWALSGRRAASIGLLIAMITVISSLASCAYAGNMGWVEEPNELRASYPHKTWWLTGDQVRLSTYIANMDETRTMEGAYADVFLVSLSGERINITRIRVREAYPLRAGEMRSFEIEWDSTGYEPGYYRLEMVGEADFEYGEDKALSNFMDGAVKLFSWDHPVFRPRVVEVDMPKTSFVPGEPFTCDVTVENEGNVPVFPVIFMTLTSENDTVWRPQMMDEPGVIYKEGERFTSHFKTWLPEDLPLGTYSCEVNVFCFAAWPSTDGSGWIPWPSGDSAYSDSWPAYSGECYYPYPMEDPSLGYPIVLGNTTWYYMPWPEGGYDGVWPWPEDVSLSLPGDDSPCTAASECGEGVFGWSDYLCEYSYGPSTCQSVDCGEIEVEEPVYGCEILDWSFTELPIPLGDECSFLAEVSNDGNTLIETDWYVFTLEDESTFYIEALPSTLEPDCDTVVYLYTEFDDIDPGEYTLELNVEGHLPWPEDVGEWMRTVYVPQVAGFLCDDEGLVDPEAWLNYPCPDEVSGLWPTFNDPSHAGGCPLDVQPAFDSTDSFFDVFYEIDFSGTPLIADSPSPVLAGIEEVEPGDTETPPEGDPVFSDWLIGDDITVTATIYNIGDLPIVSELGTVFGTMPTGVTFVIGSIDDSASIAPGDYKEYPFVWSSMGATAGTYSMSLGGAVAFSDGSGQMLYNFEPNAWVLIEPDPPDVDAEILDPTPLQPSYVEGEVQMDAEVVVQNTGSTQITEVEYRATLVDADGNVVATDCGTVGTSGPSLAGPGEETSFTTSFVSDGFAAGDYSLQVSVTTTDEHGDQVTSELTAEDCFHVDQAAPGLGFTEVSPGRDSYVDGEDYQVDAIILIENTGNVPLNSVDYTVELLDADGNVVATDTGTRETSSGPLIEPGKEDQVTGSFLTDDLVAGDYSVRVSLTGTDSEGRTVTTETYVENMIKINEATPDFDFTEVSPGRDSYVDGQDYQVDAIILIKNTGNVPLYSFDYEVKLIDSDGNVVATDTGTRETSSGPLVEPGEEDQVTGSFLTDDIPPGDYSVRVSVTGTDSEGATVTSETYVEGMIKIEEANPDFDFTEVSPGRDSYVDGEDYQVDAIILVKNTGNVPLYSFDYEVKLLDADGSVVATDTGTRETSSGPLVEPGEEDQVTASFLTDDIPAGVYSTQITVTGKDEDGNPVVNEMYVEDMINIEGSNRDFEFTEISPGRDSYVDGEDYQVDAIVLLKNTGNVPLYSFDYKVELIDADGNVVATDTGTRETSSGPLVEPGGEDQVTGSFLTDDIPPGDYSVRVSVTGKDSEGGIVTHEEFIEDMIKIAEKPDQTTGIPGFPVASMAAGLAAAMLLQHLSRSRRG